MRKIEKALRRQYGSLTAAQRKRFVVASVVFIVVGSIYFFSEKTTPPKKPNEKLKVEVVTPAKRSIDLENINASITALQRQISDSANHQKQVEEQTAEKITNLSNQVSQLANPDEITRKVKDAVDKQVKASPAGSSIGVTAGPGPTGLPAPGAQPLPNSPLPGVPGALGTPSTPTVPGAGARGIQFTTEEEEEESQPMVTAAGSDQGASKPAQSLPRKTSSSKNGPETYLPMGAILSGQNLQGADVPTLTAARRDPMPMLVKINKDAILPNHQRASVKDCFVMISGYGEISTGRANMRLERLSCILNSNKVVEVALNGYVVGEDGKQGIKGRLVTKEGEVIAKALRTGVIGAIGVGVTGALTNEFSTLHSGNVNVSLGGSGAGGNQAQQGAAGIGRSFEKITDYYSSLAKEIVPVIEIDPLRSIDLVLTRGVTIPLN